MKKDFEMDEKELLGKIKTKEMYNMAESKADILGIKRVTMNKEVEALERLRQECVNVRLIFLKDLIDQQMTEEKIAKEYVTKYKELTEIQKWEIVKAMDKSYEYNIHAWDDEIQYTIDVMETKYYK